MTNGSTPRGLDAIAEAFSARAEAGGKVFIPYIMAGDPDAETSLKVAMSVCEAGTDILELGMPFSDPMADGPVIQKAGERALEGGMSFSGLLEVTRSLRDRGVETPVICMTYVNPLMKRGYAEMASQAAAAGIDGFIVVDVPPEEATELHAALRAENLALVYLLAPTSTDERVRIVTDAASGFLYYVSMTGITGTRLDITADLRENVNRIKAQTELPVVVGFGIQAPDQAQEVARCADGVVVGSALIHALESLPREKRAEAAGEFVRPLIEAAHAS